VGRADRRRGRGHGGETCREPDPHGEGTRPAGAQGPDYTEPANFARLRDRNLGHKRSLALREYALGLESLDRAARGEPLWRIHECVFAVLALESEPVDPRL
jgi:hypothetical protein